MMLIGLYTSRVILQTLGITDFGIYNAVGGIVGMLSFISASLSNATSRFITMAIGRGDQEYINKTFGNLKVIYYGLCIIILLFGETIGLWFLYHKMTIPPERMDAAFWVYQYSILSTILGFICVPYNSAIIAHEKMSAFAYISIFDVFAKLLVCYLLIIIPYDNLIVYASLLFGIGIINRVIYAIYCNKHFEEVHAQPQIFKEQFREILVISGWTMSGNIAWMLNTQGINLILNIFFGPVVNAARGIALQVQGVMGQFVTNFQTAVSPQITKNYATQNFQRMHDLLQLSSKFSFLLMLTMSIPIYIEAPIILKWWLGIVPDNTVVFLRIILLYSIFSTLSNPLWVSILATGHLKKYQIYDNIVQLSVLPFSYIVLNFLHANAYWVFIILFAGELMAIAVRVWITLPQIHCTYRSYFKKVIIPILLTALLSPLLPYIIRYISNEGLVRFLEVCVASLLSSLTFIWLLGLNQAERNYIQSFIRSKIKH